VAVSTLADQRARCQRSLRGHRDDEPVRLLPQLLEDVTEPEQAIARDRRRVVMGEDAVDRRAPEVWHPDEDRGEVTGHGDRRMDRLEHDAAAAEVAAGLGGRGEVDAECVAVDHGRSRESQAMSSGE
jgi:hypothetical protein